jgi:hypothetical protein
MIENNFIAKRKRGQVIRVQSMRDGGVEIWLHFFLNSTLDVGWYLTPRFDRFISEGKNPG